MIDNLIDLIDKLIIENKVFSEHEYELRLKK